MDTLLHLGIPGKRVLLASWLHLLTANTCIATNTNNLSNLNTSLIEVCIDTTDFERTLPTNKISSA